MPPFMPGPLPSPVYDAVCVGGSVAGAATAAFLARQGLRVAVLDRAAFPRHKSCGEGVLPQGVAILERLGVHLPGAAPTRGIRFTAGGRTCFFPFPDGHGIAVSRYVLDQTIRARAVELGVDLIEAQVHRVSPSPDVDGFGSVLTDEGEYRGRFLIGADGTHSIFHRDLGIPTRDPGRRVGMAVHLSGFEMEDGVVDVRSLPGGETYAAPLGNGENLVALLVDRSLGVAAKDVIPFLRQTLGRPMRYASMVREVLGAAPVARRVKRLAGPGWILVGDAAGAVDPVSGEGISLALQGAELAGEVLPWALEGQADVHDYELRAREQRRSAEHLTQVLLYLSGHPRVASHVLRREEGPPALMEVALGQRSFADGVARSIWQTFA